MAAPLAERRESLRVANQAGLRFVHAPTGRTFVGRCVDTSAGGLQMLVPPTIPIMAGHQLEISTDAAPNGPLSSLDIPNRRTAEVIRVDRNRLIRDGVIAVGIRFVVG